MKLEDRYIVLKKVDVAELAPEAQTQLQRLCGAVDFIRENRGAEKLKTVVVEADWPEYGPVRRMVLDEGPTVAETLWEIALGMLFAFCVYGAARTVFA